MAFSLVPGDECALVHDLRVEGKLAFAHGDRVIIKDIDPERERPGFKYIVFSERLGADVRLRGADVVRVSCPECRASLDYQGVECVSCGWVAPEKEQVRQVEMINWQGDKRQKPHF